MRFNNDDGRKFAIRILRKFDQYGDDDAFTYEQDEPSIELFEATGFDGEEADILGYFTGIRCSIGTLFLDRHERSDAVNDEFAVWNISAENIEAIKHWLVTQLTETEKAHVPVPLTLKPYVPKPMTRASQSHMPSTSTAALPSGVETPMDSDADAAVMPRMVCCDPHTHSSNGKPFLQQELAAALQALDLAETAESQWQHGEVQVRLRIIAAKKQILQAIALLN